MSDSFEFDQSLKKVLENLEKLKLKDQQNLIRGATRAAAKPILENARSNVPVESGVLRDSIRISTVVDRKNGQAVASVKAGGKARTGDAYYAHMVEFGTERHTIEGKTVRRSGGEEKRMLKFGGRYFSSVNHPGAQAKPFMRPAFDASGQSSVDAYAEYIKRRMPILLEKNGVIPDGD